MSRAPPPAAAHRASPLLLIFFTVFLDLLGFGIIIPVLPFYAEHYGASPLVVTLLGASYSMMQFLFAPLWGRLSDRVGRRPVILVGVAMSVVGYTVFGLAHTLGVLFLARILAGIGNANIPTAQAYIADVTTPENRAKGMGILGMSFGLGFILGPALGGAAAKLGERLSAGDPAALFTQTSLPAFVAAALALVDLVLAGWLLPESLQPGAPHARAGRGFLSPAVLAHAARTPVVGVLLVVGFLFTVSWANVEQTFGLLLERKFVEHPGTPEAMGKAIALTTTALTLVGFVAAVVQGGLIGRLTRRFGEKALLASGLFLQVVALALIAYVPTELLLYPVLVLMAVANGLVNPSSSSLVSRAAPPDEQGLTLGIAQSLAALGRALGPVWGGWLFERDFHLPYVSSAVVMLVAAGFAVTIPALVKVAPPVEQAPA
ncbi:MAG: MFS transporter [Deltaproteobacteria bacterium]|nr:MFS transporter [Deltaproteobacteria bacterium]